MERGKASVKRRAYFFVITGTKSAHQDAGEKELMRVDRGCCTSFFSGPWLGALLVATLAMTAPRCVGQTAVGGQAASVLSHDELVAANEPAVDAVPGEEQTNSGALASSIPTHVDYIAVNGAHDTDAELLPEAPQPQEQQPAQSDKPLMTEGSKTEGAKTVAATTSMPMSPMYSGIIPAGMATPQIHKWDKITLATRNLYSLTSVVSFFTSAGWDQLTNGQPNYGTDRGAFGERLGAAAIRDSAQAFLSDGPFAVWLHQDPRYFALGSHHSIARRAWYAGTRALVTRDSSDGHAVVNSSLILGQAAGTALNNLYYPKSNRNFRDNLEGFGGSVGGAALSFVMDEFTSDLLRAIRLKHEQSAP